MPDVRIVHEFKVIDNQIVLKDGTIIPANLSSIPDSTTDVTTITNGIVDTHSEGFDHVYPILNYEASAILDSTSFRRIHIMDVGEGDRYFRLPEIDASYVGQWLILVRKGTLHTLYILASGSDRILNSSPGGSIECSDPDHESSSIELIIEELGLWGNPTFGIWSTR